MKRALAIVVPRYYKEFERRWRALGTVMWITHTMRKNHRRGARLIATLVPKKSKPRRTR